MQSPPLLAAKRLHLRRSGLPGFSPRHLSVIPASSGQEGGLRSKHTPGCPALREPSLRDGQRLGRAAVSPTFLLPAILPEVAGLRFPFTPRRLHPLPFLPFSSLPFPSLLAWGIPGKWKYGLSPTHYGPAGRLLPGSG